MIIVVICAKIAYLMIGSFGVLRSHLHNVGVFFFPRVFNHVIIYNYVVIIIRQHRKAVGHFPLQKKKKINHHSYLDISYKDNIHLINSYTTNSKPILRSYGTFHFGVP